MKRGYSIIYYAWGNKCKVAIVLGRLVKSNIKRQMTIDEGLLFIRLMERAHNRRKHARRARK